MKLDVLLLILPVFMVICQIEAFLSSSAFTWMLKLFWFFLLKCSHPHCYN